MMETFSPVFLDSYDPLKAGSIDGTDEYPHDKAITRALQAKFKPNKYVQGKPDCTVFVGRLGPNTTEEAVTKSMSEFGEVENVKIVRDIITGFSKCYCFVEYEKPYEARNAARNAYKMAIDDHEVLVELEKGRLLKGWVPRRLGGGLGGKRESGQLRFGGKDRPFRRPIARQDIVNTSAGGQKVDSDRKDRSRRSRSKERRRSRSRERHKDRDHKYRRR